MANLHYFHKMNGTAIGKIPMIDKRTLDLFHLHLCVRLRGGFVSVCRKKMWAQIGRELGYNGKIMTSLSTSLKSAYQKFVAPYDDFLKQAGILTSLPGGDHTAETTNNGVFLENYVILNDDFNMNSFTAVMNVLPGELPDYPSGTASLVRDYQRMIYAPFRNYRNGDKTSPSSVPTNGQLQNFKFTNGNVIQLFVYDDLHDPEVVAANQQLDPAEEAFNIAEFYRQATQRNDSAQFPIITCSHEPIVRYRNITWDEIKRPSFSNDKLSEPLEDSDYSYNECPTYNLRQFQRKADRFYEVYFNCKNYSSQNGSGVPEDIVENEYWKNLSDDNTLEVEYGADIHTSIHGSPFPQSERDLNNPQTHDPWNFNALPFQEKSFFRFVDTPVLSLVQPWLHVGMLFSSQCWHYSDLFSYVFSYHHFGGTRTWYTVPEEDFDRFRELLASIASPNDHNPAFLFEFNKMVTPESLKAHGIKCYAVDQRPGQIVVNFPKTYTSHFNHGFNLLESVNVLPIDDWLQYGFESYGLYHKYHLRPPFCLEKMALMSLQDKRDDITVK